MRRILLRGSVAAILALHAGCEAELAVPQAAQITCTSREECPAGRVCRAGLCVLPEAVDTTPPDLADAASVSPAVGRVGRRFEIALVATEALNEAPEVTLALDAPVVVPCEERSPLAYTCGYQSTGEENGGLGGVAGFDVKLVDRARNLNVKRSAGALRFDFTPPSLAARSVAPDPAGNGSVLQVFFTASEPLADPDQVVLTSSAPLDEGTDGMRSTFTLAPQGTTLNYLFTHPVTSNDPVGRVEFTVSLEDKAGNLAADLAVGGARIDSVVPALIHDNISAARVRAGTGLVVAFELTKAVQAPPVVRVGELAMERDPTLAHPLYRYTRQIATGDGEGLKAVLVSAKDEAGNPLFVSLGGVTFDFTPPGILSAQASPAVAKVGDEVFYTITPTEKLALTPALRTGPVAFEYQPGTTYAFKHTVTTGDPPGAFTATIDLVDEVGNAATDLSGQGFVFDSTIPTIGAVRTDRARYSANPGYDLVTLTFDCSEPVDGAPAALAVSLDGIPMRCGSFQASSPSYTCTHPVRTSDLAGTKNIAIAARDAAGNTGFGNGSVEFDFTLPSLLTTSVTPALAKRGDAIFYTVAPSEPLAETPVLTIGGAGSLTFLYQANTSFIFRYAITGAENEGAYTAALELTDEAGNTAHVLAGAGFSVDVSNPSVTAVAADRLKYSDKAGFNLVTVTFDVSESLDAEPAGLAVAIGGQPMSCGAYQSASPRYTCTRAVAAGEVGGPRNISVSAHDAAGNVGFGSTAVELDFAPPALLSSNVAPAAAKVGDDLFYTVTPSEALAEVPTLSVAGAGPLAFPYQNGTAYVFKHPVTPADADGAYTARVAMIDQVGNAATDLVGAGFTLDSSVPVIGAVATNRARYSAQPAYREIALTFNVSEDISGPGATLSATLGGVALDCGEYQASAPSYTCTLTVSAGLPKGTNNISISARDAAGNVGFASTAVELDFTAPALVSTDVSPALARIGDNVIYTVAPNEALAGPPVLTLSGAGALALEYQEGTKYIYKRAVSGRESGGAYTVSLVMTDEVGNTSESLESVGFALDVTVPRITAVATNRARYSAREGYKEVSLTFNVSENVDPPALLVATLGDVALDCGEYQASAPNYTCTTTIQGNETPGTKSIAISATDAAGNVGFASAAVELDFAPPGLLSTTVSPPLARIGDTVSYTVTAAEALASTPTLTIGGAASPAFVYQNGTQYIFQHLVTPEDVSGTYTASVGLVDASGNGASDLAGAEFSFDVSVPVVSGVATDRARYSTQEGFDVVRLTFNASESLDEAPASLAVSLGGVPMSCGTFQAQPPRYTCTLAVIAGAGAGTHDIAIAARDAAGNVGFASAAVIYDFTAPRPLSTSVTPALAKPGDVLSYTITPDERLAGTPTLAITGVDAPSFEYQVGTEYIYKANVGSTGGGAYTAAITMTDEAGNVASAIPVSGFSLDTTVPAITGVTTNRPRYSAQLAYRAVTVTFDTSESLSVPGASLSATIGTESMSCTTYQATSPSYVCSYTVTGNEGGGTKSIALSARDAAGNVGFGSTSVVFDFAGPTLAATSVNPPLAKPGDQVSYTVTPSEALSANPTLTIGGAGALAFTYQGGTSYIFKRTISGSDPSGAYTAQISMTDQVGNASGSLNGDGFSLDTTVPSVSAVATDRARYSAQSGYNTVTLTFNVSENVDAAPASLSATIGGTPMTCGSYQATTPRYTCTYAVTGGSGGTRAIAITARDAAGNQGFGSASVVFDFTPPGIFSTSVTPALAKIGDQIVYTVTPSEPLSATPALTVTRVGGTQTLPFAFQNGTAYIYKYTEAGTEVSGTYQPRFSMIDEAGNQSSNLAGATFALDATVPVISGVSVQSDEPYAPGRANAGSWVTATFDVSEPISGAGVRVTVGAFPMSCDQGDAPDFTCTYTLDGAEIPDGTEATQSVLIEVEDAAGNRSTGSGSIVFDFRPPGIASAGVTYQAGENNPLPNPSEATGGTTIWVTVVVDESLDPTSSPSLRAVQGGTTLSFTRASWSGNQLLFWKAIDAPVTIPDGGYVLRLTATDLVGNSTSQASSDQAIAVDGTPPVLSVVQSQVSFLRSPWGSTVEEDIGGFAIPAGPYFALAPVDAMSSDWYLPANTFTVEGGAAPSMVRIWTDGTASARLLGTVRPYGFGGWPRQTLSNLDTSAAWASAVDSAGNESEKVKLVNAEWVATLNPPAFGRNQNTLQAASYAEPSLRQDPFTSAEVDPTLLPYVSGPNGWGILAGAQAAWRQKFMMSAEPTGRSHPAMAYDSGRGRMVVFGGNDNGGENGETWEWDGEIWINKTPAVVSPTRRTGAAMAYDSHRGRVVLFGGDDGSYMNDDTWEWDGTSWVQRMVAGPKPAARRYHRLVYDAGRRKVVLFGGSTSWGGGYELQDTWEWDGDAWSDKTPAGTKPSARESMGLAYDSVRGRVVMFGGGLGNWFPTTGTERQDVWEWDGTSWVDRTPSGTKPSARTLVAMTYDPVRQRSIVFGGVYYNGSQVVNQEIWEWNGATTPGTWTNRTPSGTKPSARRDHVMAYDLRRSRAVMFGGYPGTLPSLSDIWDWDGVGQTWANRTPAPGPGARINTAMAYDSFRGRTVLYGGSDGASATADTWEWDGVRWTRLSPPGANPGPRSDHRMAYDSVRKRTVLFGGWHSIFITSPTKQDVWEWDGSTWTGPLQPGTPPAARGNHSMAFDLGRNRVVIFGGDTGAVTYRQDLWEWSGSAWLDRTPGGTKPAARAGAAMCALGTKLVLFGGSTSSSYYKQDLWEWDGASATWTQKTPSWPYPSNRTRAAMVRDSLSGRAILFGGSSQLEYKQDLWEWNGTSWTERTPSGYKPSGRGYHAMAYDEARGRAVIFGGTNGTYLNDTWVWDAASDRQPALLFTAQTSGDFPPSAVTGLLVRAHAGGKYAPYGAGDVGAALFGWNTGGPGLLPGRWTVLAANDAGVSSGGQPYLAAPPAAFVQWTASSATEAQRYMTERDRQLSFQLRPEGSSGNGVTEAQVALDYVEVRVRYTAP